MNIKHNINLKKIIISLVVIICLLMIFFPEIVSLASKKAIFLWLNSIVPTMLPFFIVSGFLKKSGLANRISHKKYPFVMAALSGYPMGASIIGDYRRTNILNDREMYYLLSYCMVTGPAFLMGTVGHDFLHSYKSGIILMISHYSGALINGMLLKKCFLCNATPNNNITTKTRKNNKGRDNYYENLTDSINESFKIMGIILAYIMMFMIITSFIDPIKKLSKEGKALLKGILEMTVGCSLLSATGFDVLGRLTIATFLISFGGLSVMGQSISMLSECNIKIKKLLLIKVSQGIISSILAFSIGSFVL